MCFDLGMFYKKGTLLSPGSCRGRSSGLERECTGCVPPWGCSRRSDATGRAASAVSPGGHAHWPHSCLVGRLVGPQVQHKPGCISSFQRLPLVMYSQHQSTRETRQTQSELTHIQPKESQPPSHEISSAFCPPLLPRVCILRSSKPSTGAVRCPLTWAPMGLCKSLCRPPPSCQLVPGTTSSPRLPNPSSQQTHSSTLESSTAGLGVGAPGGGSRMALSVPRP